MTVVTVKKVRTACVLQSPPMSMPAQWQESRSVAGGTPSVVSKTIKSFLFECSNRENLSMCVAKCSTSTNTRLPYFVFTKL